MRFTIPSHYAAGRDVQRRILEEVSQKGFDSDDTFAIQLALEEALVNAIKHGNRLDPQKQVKVQATITPRRAEIVVEDEGPGFDRKCVADPTDEANLSRTCGRGILLMEAYMTKVEWSKGGRRVRLVKLNSRAGRKRAG